MTERLVQYRGALTSAQVAAGINAARQNSIRLVQDAKVLAELGRFPSALALAILSIEESGKVAILREISYSTDEKALKGAWKHYRSHTSKNVLWTAPDLIRDGAREVSDFAPLFDRSSDHPLVLDQLKQIALYTDCLGTGKWTIPVDVIDRDLTLSIVQVAKTLASEKETTVEEVELWIEVMGPVLRGPAPVPWIRKAFKRWYKEAARRGMIDPNNEIYREFVHGKQHKE